MTVREKLAAAREIEKGTAQREPSPVSTKPPAAAPAYAAVHRDPLTGKTPQEVAMKTAGIMSPSAVMQARQAMGKIPIPSKTIKAQHDSVSAKVKAAENEVRQAVLERTSSGGYAAVSGTRTPAETPKVASSYAAASEAHKTKAQEDEWAKGRNLGALYNQQSELAGKYYFMENEEQEAKIRKDSSMMETRQGVRDLQSDIRMAQEVAADAMNPGSGGEPGKILAQKRYLEQKYGITQAALRNYALYGDDDSAPEGGYTNISQLIHQLEREQQGLADDMKAAGYDYGRMERYQQRRKDIAEAKVRAEERAKAAQEDPGLASLGTVFAKPFQGIDYGMALLEGLGRSDSGNLETYEPLNTARMDTTNAIRTVRGTISKDIEEKWGPVGSFAYQTGMSMADFLFAAAATGNFSGGGKLASNLSLGIMGSSAAADTTVNALERGLSNRQALTLGAIAGVAEIVTEKVSLDALLGKLSEGKGRLAYFLANTIAEGSEEGASDLINWTADVLIAGDKSEWKQAIAAYQQQGLDERQAFFCALRDKALEIGVDVAGGMLSGGLMSGVSIGVDMYQDKTVGRDWRKTLGTIDTETYQAFIDTGLESDPDSEAYRVARKAQAQLDKKGELSDSMLGRLYRANVAAIEAEESTKPASTEGAAKPGEYRLNKPQNVDMPTVPIINLSVKDIPGQTSPVLTVGNSLRPAAIERARQRLGLDQNSAAYIPASNVMRDGNEYVLKITPTTLKKMLNPSGGGEISVESIVVMDNLERIANNGVCFDSKGDQDGRPQIAGFDYLKTTVYIDGAPYEVRMRVRLVEEVPGKGADNVLYYFSPEEIVTIEKVGTKPPKAGLRETQRGSGEAPTYESIIPQTAQNVNPELAQQAKKIGQAGISPAITQPPAGTLLAEAYDLACRMGPYGQKGLSEALGVRKLGGDFNETDFLIGYIDVYLAALKGVPHGPTYLPATVDSHARQLSLVERMQAYHNGINDAKARTQAAQSVDPETGIPQAAAQGQTLPHPQHKAQQENVLTQEGKPDTITSSDDDIQIGRSLGAAAFRDPVRLPDGRITHITEGSKITKVVTFAGGGTGKSLRVAQVLAKSYNVDAVRWIHRRGDGFVDVDGISEHAELHWFEHPDVGRIQMKVKRYFKDES